MTLSKVFPVALRFSFPVKVKFSTLFVNVYEMLDKTVSLPSFAISLINVVSLSRIYVSSSAPPYSESTPPPP